MAMIVHSPHDGQPVKVRDQDLQRAIRDGEGRIFYAVKRSDGQGYYGAFTRKGSDKDEQRYLEMLEKTETAREVGKARSAEQLHDATGKANGPGMLRWVILFIVAALIAAVTWYLVQPDNDGAGASDRLRESPGGTGEPQGNARTTGDTVLVDGPASLAELYARLRKEGYVGTASGLRYKILSPGKGEMAVAGRYVLVEYTGANRSGHMFDRSEPGRPVGFVLWSGEVPRGWDEGVVGMRVGEVRRLVLSPELVCGPYPGDVVVPDGVLSFDIRLVGILPGVRLTMQEPGEGAIARPGDTVRVHYEAFVGRNPVAFDSTYERTEPAEMNVGTGEVITGWEMGVVGMTEGETRLIEIPPSRRGQACGTWSSSCTSRAARRAGRRWYATSEADGRAGYCAGRPRPGTLSGMIKRIAALILIMFAVPILVGGFGDPRPKADFVFSITTEHNNRDPQRMTYLHDIRLTHALLETLVVLDFNDMQTYAGVAESWETSDDGLTYTFRLRDDARWSNGDLVTSHDFVYAWRRAMLPDTAAGYGHFMFFIRGAEDYFTWRNEQLEAYIKEHTDGSGTEEAARACWEEAERKFKEMVALSAPDDRTLIIELNRRTEYFIDMLAFATYMPVHAESVRSAVVFNAETGRLLDDPTYWNDPDRFLCNGPYRLADRKYRQYNFLAANEHYWDRASVKNDSVMELIVNNEQSQLLSYEAGDIDYVPTVIPDIAFDLMRQDRDDVHVVPMAGTYFYNFNCLPKLKSGEENPLADWRVRRALAMAIDRDEISRSITRLNEPSAFSFVPPTALNFYDPPVEDGPKFDPQGARALLAEAGHAGGEGVTGLSILYNTGAGRQEHVGDAPGRRCHPRGRGI
jgi:oligopeptide transport system substrate-binding protein